nr:hypothetical protein [Alcaligenes faecalis]
MKYALKLARHGSIFLGRVSWIAAMLVVDVILLLMSSSKDRNNMAGPEVSDGIDRLHPNCALDWGWQENDSDKK